MVNRSSISGRTPTAPRSVPAPGAQTKVGIQPPQIGTGLGGPLARMKKKNTRDYRKPAVAPAGPAAPQPNPFGSSGGNSNLGGF